MLVHSIDFSENAQEKARRLARARNVDVEFERADILNWKWPENHYDAVVAIFIQFTPPDDRAMLFEKMKRAVKPGGLILMEGYGPKQMIYKTGGPGILEQLTTRELLEQSFADWEIIDLEDYECTLNEGTRHSGTSHLIDIVARKPKEEFPED